MAAKKYNPPSVLDVTGRLYRFACSGGLFVGQALEWMHQYGSINVDSDKYTFYCTWTVYVVKTPIARILKCEGSGKTLQVAIVRCLKAYRKEAMQRAKNKKD